MSLAPLPNACPRSRAKLLVPTLARNLLPILSLQRPTYACALVLDVRHARQASSTCGSFEPVVVGRPGVTQIAGRDAPSPGVKRPGRNRLGPRRQRCPMPVQPRCATHRTPGLMTSDPILSRGRWESICQCRGTP